MASPVKVSKKKDRRGKSQKNQQLCFELRQHDYKLKALKIDI